MLRLLLCGVLGVLVSPASADAPFPAVSGFRLERYLGRWYEIARLPHSFEKGLDSVTAEYTLRPDGRVKVVNRGYRNGKLSSATGKGKLAGAADTGHLKVSFFLMFYADYIIVELDPDYQYALVAGGSTEYLWILARTPALAPEVVQRLKDRAASLGFDLTKLIMVAQPVASVPPEGQSQVR